MYSYLYVSNSYPRFLLSKLCNSNFPGSWCLKSILFCNCRKVLLLPSPQPPPLMHRAPWELWAAPWGAAGWKGAFPLMRALARAAHSRPTTPIYPPSSVAGSARPTPRPCGTLMSGCRKACDRPPFWNMVTGLSITVAK
jgi:hypothetical protein